MAFIKCPECGHTALSVASTCPSCGHLLVQNPMQGRGLGMVACRGCQKQVSSTESVCPFCGHQIRRWRTIRMTAWSVLAVVLLIGGIALFSAARKASRPPVASPALPVVQAPEAQPVTVPAPPRQVATAVSEQQRPAPEPSPATPNTEARWTANWVNVRESPGTGGAIVGVLRPGTAVGVGEFRRGWWAVYTDGRLLGWAAGDLLVPTRPDTLP